MGKPKNNKRQLSLWTFGNQINYKQKQICSIIDGSNLITIQTIQTIQNLLINSNNKINSVFLFIDKLDWNSQKLIQSNFNKYFYKKQSIQIQSSYNFINQKLNKRRCTQIIYLQYNSKINKNNTQNIVKLYQNKKLQNQKVYYSVGKSNQKLPQLNLHQIQSLNFNIYFIPKILYQLILPFNFAFYTKFNLRQILLLPILIISQISNSLLKLQNSYHQVQKLSKYNFQQFQINQPNYQKDSFCIISTTTNPYQIKNDTLQYLQNVSKLNLNSQNITVIMSLPYNQNIDKQIVKNILNFLFNQRKNNKKINFKIRLANNKALLPLLSYQSSYIWCPKNSVIISSRNNIQFKQNFLAKLNQKLNQKYHYYTISYSHKQNPQRIKHFVNQKFKTPYQFRQKSNLIQNQLNHLQIYKIGLFRSFYFQLLKCQQIDFYQTQASFILPMIQMIRTNIGIINLQQSYYFVKNRVFTQKQKNQIRNLRNYYQWNLLPDGKMYPYQFNSLNNQAYRRYAPNKIQKIIHQIWQGGKPNQFRLKLHQTLSQKNPNFNMFMWGRQNITVQNFPLTYNLILRSLQYQKHSNRSYFAPIASLIRYQSLYNYGGIYFDYKTQGLKQLDPFLKYQIFFTDAAFGKSGLINPNNVGNPMMGAMKNSYYLRIVLNQLIRQNKVDYRVVNFPTIVGAYILRKSLNNQQFFHNIGLGFHLFSPRPDTDQINLCGYVLNQNNQLYKNYFDKTQQIFDVQDVKSQKIYRIGIPCKYYPQTYALMYKPLGRTWVGKK